MNDEREQVITKLRELCNGNTDATNFLLNLWSFICVWDDAIDQDKPADEAQINAAMMWALFGMHESAFYIKHDNILRTMLMHYVSSWLTANKFEKSGDRDLIEQAYFMRCAFYDVVSTVAFLCGGFSHQMAAMEYCRALAPNDTLESYMKEHFHGMAEQS